MIHDSFPSADLIEQGVRDLASAQTSVAALLVLVGAPCLRELGIDLPDAGVDFPEHALYELLAREEPSSAHSRYNALIRALVSFERAAECAKHKHHVSCKE